LKTQRALDRCGMYVTLSWSPLCAEVAKLRIARQPRGQVVRLPATVEKTNNDFTTAWYSRRKTNKLP
jgi:hypothetical protein